MRTRLARRNQQALGALCLLFAGLISIMAPGIAAAQSGLPWHSGFESGDFSEWNGYSRGDVTISTQNPAEGNYSAYVPIVAGTLNDSYYEHYFGDHAITQLDRVDELYLSFSSKFDSGTVWPRAESHKMAILNITDGQSWNRRYQVYVFVDSNGRYSVDHSYIDSWRFMGLPQNVGAPTSVTFDQWDRLKLYVRLNTPGASDGIVRMWVNGELKVDYDDVNLREGTPYSMNKLILSSYTSHESGGNGVQWYDDWTLSESDPDTDTTGSTPMPPTLLD